MCDYSLHSIKNRLANENEQLFVHTFHTGSKGLAAVSDLKNLSKQPPLPEGVGLWARFRHWLNQSLQWMDYDVQKALPAVCIPPGARLEVQEIPPRLQKEYGVGPRETVTFVQLSADPYRYRDAIRFGNGQEVLLQKLTEGLRLDVVCLSLPEEVPEPAPTSFARQEVSVG
ncbi:MAG TPA: hypothetical protein VNQ79_04285 [Blastocatellia bacterium]|nr:hypothetical protein [Blastocatellia bacterium]